LLSVFFIVVILLGVFFTMGYIVGRNSAPLNATDVASAHKPEDKPVMVDSAAAPQSAPASAPKAGGPIETAAQQPPPEQPKAAEPAKPEPKVEPKPERKSEPAKPKPREPEKAASGSGQPEAGQTYLQLAATTEHEANIEVDVLRKKGFRAVAAEIPEKRGTFRVLVGPLAEGAANKTKADLQSAGFPGQKAIRRTL